LGASGPAVYEPALRRDANSVKLRLMKAGINLDGYTWTLNNIFYNPVGFDFTCTDHHRLVQEAERSRSLALHFADLAGNDPWLKVGLKSVGYTEIGAAGPVHLDIAIDRPGTCRAYLMPHGVKFKADAMRMAQLKTAQDNAVYAAIARRLGPLINLDHHIAKLVSIGDTTLDGINFVARDYKKLKQALIDAKDGAGNPFFAHATLEDKDHWALKASFMATDGTGFREVFRLKISDRPLLDGVLLDKSSDRRMRSLAGHFSDNTAVPDLS
jgi:hypothetical protein